jgi:hypothetical protein
MAFQLVVIFRRDGQMRDEDEHGCRDMCNENAGKREAGSWEREAGSGKRENPRDAHLL